MSSVVEAAAAAAAVTVDGRPKCSTNSVVQFEIALLKQTARDKVGVERVLERMSKGTISGIPKPAKAKDQ